MERREVYTSQQPDGTYVTTTTRTQTKYAEDKVYGCGIGQTDKYYCLGPHGLLRILEIDLVFSATCCFSFIVLAIVEAYYSTGSWSNNCNDIGSDGFIHNGCRIIYEWAFAS
ncbi:hypothetical protein OESDEN_24239, partial [Oesophagostomum dentatum]